MSPPTALALSRREFLQWAGAAAALAALPAGCAGPPRGAAAPGSFFSDEERRALGALANAVLPPDDAPGGEALGAVDFIERLLTALDGPAPALYAGGPFSDRNPFPDGQGGASALFPANDFATLLPVDRVSLAAWRLQLFGSRGVPGGGPNDAVTGPVVGLRELFKDGLARAIQGSPAPLETLDPAALKDRFDHLDLELHDVLIELVSQAALSAPEYGGNPGGAGWRMIHFEGDNMPLGFSRFDEVAGLYRERPDAPVSTADPGPDPDPVDDDARAFVATVVALLGGRVFE